MQWDKSLTIYIYIGRDILIYFASVPELHIFIRNAIFKHPRDNDWKKQHWGIFISL